MPSGVHGSHRKGAAHPKYKGRALVRKTALYRLWLNIRNRCNNRRTGDYKYYGARGVKVCPSWDSYEQFVSDVGPHPGNGLTLDRIDASGNYEPNNVRWATRQTQARNRNYCKLSLSEADTIRREYSTGKFRQIDLAKKFGVTQTLISKIIRGVVWA